MDKRRNDELKLKKKLSKTANKILKNRKNTKKVNNKIEEFEKIKQLLILSEIGTSDSPEESVVAEQPFDSLTSSSIPISPPGIEIFHEDDVFWLFNEETLCLRDFLNDGEGCNAFGEENEVPNESTFRDLIIHYITENLSPDTEKCHPVSLYVLYLMSVHSDQNFVSDCLDFLKFRRIEISAGELLPIFVNFGSSSEVLTGTEIEIELPRDVNKCVKKGKRSFPYYNVEMVAKFIFNCATLNLIKREPETKLLLKALARLTLDWKIRNSRLLSIYSALISVISSQLVETFGVYEVVPCLHLKEEHVLNRVEIVRTVLMPVSPVLYEALVIKTINFILKTNILRLHLLKVEDIIKVLKLLRNTELTPLEIYCILLLINGSLPRITAKARQIGNINSELISLETSFFNVKDSVDSIRLKLEIAKLKNLVTNSVNKNSSDD